MGLFDILNVIPIVGHVKATIHYICDDVEGGNRAMLDATRSTMVIAGGAVGSVGGPALAATLAIGAASLTDSVTSVATGTPQGVIKSMDDIVQDISDGKVPVGSVAKAAIGVAADGLGGLGGAGIVNIAKEGGKAAAKEIGKKGAEELLKKQLMHPRNLAVYAANQIKDQNIELDLSPKNTNFNPPKSETKQNQNQNQNQNNGSKQNQKQNNQNRDNSNQNNRDPQKPNFKFNTIKVTDQELLEMFLKFFKVNSLNDIRINRRYPFKNLSSGQLNYLVKLLRNLNFRGQLDNNLEVTVDVMNRLSMDDVTFENFLSIAELTAAERGQRARLMNDRLAYETNATSAERENIIWNSRLIDSDDIMDIIRQVRGNLGNLNLRIPFRNDFSAIYHFWKHRLTPNCKVLSLNQYFDFINQYTKVLQKHPLYKDFQNGLLEYLRLEVFIKEFSRRFLIVLKTFNFTETLSTAYFIDRIYEEDDEISDEEGTPKVDGPKKKGKKK